MNQKLTKTTSVEHYVDEFTRRQKDFENDGLQLQRRSAIELFQQNGFPTTRQENWKYTDVRSIARHTFSTSTDAEVELSEQALNNIRFNELACHELVLINGQYSSIHSHLDSLPDGVIIKDIVSALEQDNELLTKYITQYADNNVSPFTALNTAFIHSGSFIFVPDNIVIETPINVLFLSGMVNKDLATLPRNVIVLGNNAQATVIESYIGLDDAQYFTNAVTEASLAAGAQLTHYKVQQESRKSYHIGNFYIHQEKDSRCESHSISLGGSLVRNDIYAQLNAEGAEIILNGLYLADGKQHIDNHTRIDHLKPNTRSEENYRGVLNDHARGVFNGKVVVHKDAQKTDAQQTNANLLLSDNAEVDTKPELEIYADDVKCAHGATVGQLDQDMLFYLRTRAIDEETAKSLLSFAFADEVIGRIQFKPIRDRLEQLVVGRLPDADLIREFTHEL